MSCLSVPRWWLRRFLVAGLVGLSNPGGFAVADEAAGGTGPGALFDRDHVYDVRIEMKQADWECLSVQAYDMSVFMDESYLDEMPLRPYTYFPATVTIDGEVIKNVGVRKKGFLGSVNTIKPSLKLSLDEYVDGQEFRGTSRFTLQNNYTDQAQVTQALACHVYDLAGLPAPRCNFARVTVNGVDLGVFTHIEAIKKPFLRRAFGDDSGNLYEGRLSDFRPRFVKTFEKKTNKKEGDRSDLQAVTEALASEDEVLLERVGAVVDLDQFIKFWAVTSLIQFWDSYPGASNNFFCYNNPASGKFAFIPWAPDSAFRDCWFAIEERPKSVYADGYLAHRLYGIPEVRERYRATMTMLLEKVWKEEGLLAEVQRMVDLLAPHSHYPEERWADEVDKIRARIKARRGEITSEFAEPLEEWPYPPQPEISWVDIGDVACEFSIPVTPDPTQTLAELTVELHGQKRRFGRVHVVAVPQDGPLSRWLLMFLGFENPMGGTGLLVPVHEKYFGRGAVPMDGNNVTSWIINFAVDPEAEGFKMSSYGMGWGEAEFERVEGEEGPMIKGRLTADVLKIPIH